MISKKELKFIKSLKVKKYRLREKRFLAEGAKNVLELVNSNYKIDLILSTEEFYETNSKLLNGQNVVIATSKMLQEVGTFQSNNSCLAVVFPRENKLDEIDLKKQIFVLDGVGDPGNLGTIIRTLDWFGYDQLICSPESAELYNPKVINSTMGSFTKLRVWYLDLVNFLSDCPLAKYGAEMRGSNLFETPIAQPSVVVMGSESHGISHEIQGMLDHSICIPKYGKAESLNVGMATGIIASYLRMS